jgi:(p)ppGpp synthase/HD superfamily hydrolase
METEMFDETWYRNTLALARRLHAGQAAKGGQPYIEHVERVARILVERFPDATPEQVQAALLHDVLEDCDTRQSASGWRASSRRWSRSSSG